MRHNRPESERPQCLHGDTDSMKIYLNASVLIKSKKQAAMLKKCRRNEQKAIKKQTYEVLDGGVTTAQNQGSHSVGMAAGGRLMQGRLAVRIQHKGGPFL